MEMLRLEVKAMQTFVGMDSAWRKNNCSIDTADNW